MRKVIAVYIFGLLISAIWNVSSASAQYVTDGLVAFYTLDEADIAGEVVKDASGNGNDATIIGTLKPIEGVIGESLDFDRAQNSIEIPAMGAWEQVSMECWALTRNLGHDYQGIVSTWQWTAGKVHFKFEGSQIQVHKNDGVKITAPAEIETWYHIIYTTDVGAGELKLYVDGELVAEGASGGTPENMDERRIGSEHDGRFLDGMIDEVRIYDRVLDADEVDQNFHVESRGLAIEPGSKLATTWGRIKF